MQQLEETIGKVITSAVNKAVALAFDKARQYPPTGNLFHAEPEPEVARGYYYLDEAGDANIFAHGGKVIIGNEGCSRFSMLGMLDVRNPTLLKIELEELRRELLSDTYFKGVPSFQPEERKTALAFHAKNDLPEVRREVFHLLLKHDIHFFAVVHDKQSVLKITKQIQQENSEHRYSPNDQYDLQVKHLCQGRLHKQAEYNIRFSRRGKSDRTEALKKALEDTQAVLNLKYGITEASKLHVSAHFPHEFTGLQAVDYFLWALQRFYERREERYINLLQEKCSLIIDRHDTRLKPSGMHYTKEKPLTKAAWRE